LKATSQEIIAAYKETGSVWKAAKILGMSGQTVHERLKALDYKLPGENWSVEEVEELKSLVGQLTIGQIANRLGRPYNGVAIKISRLGVGERFGNKVSGKIPRTENYRKINILKYMDEIDAQKTTITKYAKQNGLNVETLARCVQRYDLDWWNKYSEEHATGPKVACPNCNDLFYPQSKKQVFCTRKCSNDYRVDQSYFGGKRKETIGLAEGVCQLCGRHVTKGLSSHHVIGKENDPNNDFLIALCQGCHQIVTIMGGRSFIMNPETWESLIQLVILRREGARSPNVGVYAYVEIEVTKDNE